MSVIKFKPTSAGKKEELLKLNQIIYGKVDLYAN